MSDNPMPAYEVKILIEIHDITVPDHRDEMTELPDKLHTRTQTTQLLRSRVNIQQDANCVNKTCLIKRSHCDALFCLIGQVSRPMSGKAISTFGGRRREVCAARPHAGAGASAMF